MQNKWKWLGGILVALMFLAITYKVGVDRTKAQYNGVEVNVETQHQLDSMFQDMLDKVSKDIVRRDTLYNNTRTIYKKVIQSYEKVNSIHPYNDRDSLLQSLTRISNTPK